MNKLQKYLSILMMMPVISFAGNSEMKETLVQIIDALESVKVLVNKAEGEQDKNPRYKVHFSKFKDINGTYHNGLRDDLNEIQQSLIEVVNDEQVEPRKISALENDFVSKNHG